MKKRTVLITGGAKRVGKEIALSLANKDTNLIIHYNKSLLEAKKLKLLLEERGSKCALIKSNLSNQKDLKKIINNAKKFFGTINCLINNASLFLNDNVESFSDKLWNDHLNINLLVLLYFHFYYKILPYHFFSDICFSSNYLKENLY